MGILSDLKEKQRVLKGYLQKGRHMSPGEVEDMEEHECLNCHTRFRGRFCPWCGQSAGTKRLTFKDGFETVLTDLIKFNRGMSHTLLELIYRPGYLAYDYINGYRKEYYPPIALLLILVAIPLLLNSFIPPSGSATQLLVASLEAELKNSGAPMEPFKFFQKVLSIGSVRVVIEALLTVPALWLCFHWTKVGKQTNWAETFYLSVFIACNELLFGLLFYPFEFISYKVSGMTMSGWLLGGPVAYGTLFYQDYISAYVALAVQIWMLRCFYKISWCSTILRYIVYYMLIGVTFLLLMILMITVVFIYYYIH